MRIRRHHRAVLALFATTSLGLAACGSGSSKAASDIPSLGNGKAAGGPTTTVNVEQAVGKFVACLRKQGLQVADPKIDSNGRVDMRSIFEGTNLQRGSADFRKYMDACGDVLRNAGFGPSAEDRKARQEAMLKYTACLRKQGLQVADLTFDGPGGRGGGFGGPGRDGNGGGGATTTTANGTGTTSSVTQPSIGGGGPGDGGPGDGPGDGGGFRGPATPEERNQRLAERLGVDYSDPKVKAAFEACQSVLAALRPPNGGPGGPGFGPTTTTKG